MAKARHDRAAQFAPFAALSGFEEEIRRRTVTIAPRRELLTDEAERINAVLTDLSLGDTVRVTYYRGGAYITALGVLTRLDRTYGTLTVVKNEIPISDVFDIEKMQYTRR